MNPKQIFHLFCFGVYAYVCWWDYLIVNPKFLPIPGNYFSKFVWLTLIDLYLQTFYHLYGIYAGGQKKNTTFHFIARSLVGPIGMAVVILFWALFLANPDFLLADENAKRIIAIKWYNHGLHTLPMLTVLLDLLVWNHGQPAKDSVVKAMAAFSIVYIIDIHFVHYHSGFWAYPILGMLPLPARALFIVAAVGVIYANFVLLTFVHKMWHGVKVKSK